MNKKISIIVPCYNVDKYIDRCLASLINQTIGKEKIEIICVNDASEDNTLDRLLRWEHIYPDTMIVVDCPNNRGVGGARNAGLSYAKGTYIGFVDADDWIEETMFEKMYGAMETYGCDITRCHHIRDSGFGNIWDTQKMRTAPDHLLEITNEEERRKFMAADSMDGGCTNKLYTRSIIFDNHLTFVENLAYEDVPWGALFYLYVNKVYFLNEKLYHYFVNPNSIVLANDKNYHMDLLTTSKIKMEEFQKRGAMEKYKNEIELSFLISYFLAGMKMLAFRYTDYKYEEFKQLCSGVNETVPDYAQNPYLDEMLHELCKLQVSLIDKDISFEEYKTVVDIMKNAAKS